MCQEGQAQVSIQVIFIDSTTLSPSTNECCNSKGGISSTTQAARINNQLGHIERMLESATQDPPTWLLVMGHYPIYSVGEHGDNSEMISYLQPLLEKYKVHAYFCGHDHVLEHLQSNGIEYFVSGAASMNDKLGGSSSATNKWGAAYTSGFNLVTATSDELRVSFVGTSATEIYSTTLTNPFRAAIVASPSFAPSWPSTAPPLQNEPVEDSHKSRSTTSAQASLIFVGSVGALAIVICLSSRGGSAWRRMSKKINNNRLPQPASPRSRRLLLQIEDDLDEDGPLPSAFPSPAKTRSKSLRKRLWRALQRQYLKASRHLKRLVKVAFKRNKSKNPLASSPLRDERASSIALDELEAEASHAQAFVLTLNEQANIEACVVSLTLDEIFGASSGLQHQRTVSMLELGSSPSLLLEFEEANLAAHRRNQTSAF